MNCLMSLLTLQSYSLDSYGQIKINNYGTKVNEPIENRRTTGIENFLIKYKI